MPKKPKLTTLPELATEVRSFVFIHTQGAYAGLRRIIGINPAMAAIIKKNGGPPTFLTGIDLTDHTNGCSLIRVSKGAAYYREIMPLPTGKLGDFHPEQR
jgi:hypothetical protein